MSEHVWVQENLGSYLAGGLTVAEGEQLERHAAGCKECSRTLGDWRSFDERLCHLFADVRPAAGWKNLLGQPTCLSGIGWGLG